MIRTVIGDVSLAFETRPELFSPRAADAGSLALLAQVDVSGGDKILDLGCGYGLMGIYAAKLIGAGNVFLTDNDPLAVELAASNAGLNGVDGVSVTLSDGFRDFRETNFTKILCNPPYHSDFSVAKHFIEKGFNRLDLGGSMWFVTKRDRWYRRKLSSVFGGVTVRKTDTYFVFEAVRKSKHFARR